MKCVKCNKIIDDGDLFCGCCGINQAKFRKYINKVAGKIHKGRDKECSNRLKQAQNKLKQLEKAKQNEINRISNSRWRSCGSDSFSYNMMEGKVNINGNMYLFSDINGAEMIKEDEYRVVTTETGKSKKHASLGGAVAGGLILGPVGAVVGGSVLGKTKSTGQSISNSIPTCNHIGVNVNIKGFNSEIVLLTKTVDKTSSQYTSNVNTAQKIVDTLRNLASTPVPKSFLKPEEEKTVLDFDPQIETAAKELQDVVADKPNYDIPESYYK